LKSSGEKNKETSKMSRFGIKVTFVYAAGVGDLGGGGGVHGEGRKIEGRDARGTTSKRETKY